MVSCPKSRVIVIEQMLRVSLKPFSRNLLLAEGFGGAVCSETDALDEHLVKPTRGAKLRKMMVKELGLQGREDENKADFVYDR